MILDKSNKIIFEKFRSEFHNVLQNDLKQDILPNQINSFEFTQLITQLGCAKTDEMMDDNSKVFKRCEELWTCLSQTALKTLDAETRDVISVDDTLMYLLAIFSINGHPRMNARPPLSPEKENVDKLPVGFLDDKRQLCLTDNCADQIKSRFKILN